MGIVLFTVLLAAALLPLQQEYPSIPAIDLMARALVLMKWMIVGCSAAGLTATLKLLGERRRTRPAA